MFVASGKKKTIKYINYAVSIKCVCVCVCVCVLPVV